MVLPYGMSCIGFMMSFPGDFSLVEALLVAIKILQ
jgi:hypothetical protein